MTDYAKELEHLAKIEFDPYDNARWIAQLCRNAAAELRRLQDENERLRDAELSQIADVATIKNRVENEVYNVMEKITRNHNTALAIIADKDKEIVKLKADNEKFKALAKFGKWALNFHIDDYESKYCGHDRDAAIALNLMEMVRVMEPCGGSCECKISGFGFPRDCARQTRLAQLPEGL